MDETLHTFEKERHLLRDKVATILILLYFLLTISNTYCNIINESLSWYIGLIIAAFAAGYSIISSGVLLRRKELFFYVIILYLHFFSILYNGNTSITSPIQYLRHIFIAISLTRVKLWDKAVKLVYYCFCFYFVLAIIRGLDAEMVTAANVSRNAISMHLLIFEILLLLSYKERIDKKIIFAEIVAIAVIVWTGSWSGLIASGILFVGTLKRFSSKSNKRKIIVGTAFIFALVICVVLLRSGFVYSDYMYYFTEKLGRSIFKNVRFVIIFEFFEKAFSSIGNFIFGPILSSLSSTRIYAYNPHNSYLLAYGNFGLVFFIMIILKICIALKKYWKTDNLMFFMLLSLSLRSFTDVSAFPSIYDSLFYFFII